MANLSAAISIDGQDLTLSTLPENGLACLMDPAGVLLAANPGFRETIVPRWDGTAVLDFCDMVAEDERDKFVGFLLDLQSIGSGQIELSLLPCDDAELLLQMNAVLKENDKGDAIGVLVLCTNLSDQSNFKDLLHRSEQKFLDIVHAVEDIIQEIDLDGRIAYVNRAWVAKFGYTVFESENLTWRDLVHEKSKAAFEAAMASTLSGVGQENLQIVFQAKNDLEIISEGKIVPRLVDGEIMGIRCLFLDMTIRHLQYRELLRQRDQLETWVERRTQELADQNVQLQNEIRERQAAELAAIESEKRYRELIEGSVQGVIIFQDAKIIFANPAAERMFKYQQDGLMGKPIQDLVHPSDRRRVVNYRRAHKEGRMEFKALASNGGDFWLEEIAQTITWEGRPARLSTFVDISDRKENEKLLSAAVENLDDGFVIFDDKDRMVLCNSQFREIYSGIADVLLPGVPMRTVAERTARDLIGLTDLDDIEQWVQERLAQQRTTRPFEQALRDGRYIRVSESRLPNGWLVGMRSDITELKKVEAELRQSQKMEVVGQLTGGVAHDFNNLLSAILGHAEMIALDLGDDDPRTEAIIQAALRGSELTSRLMAFSRKQSLAPQPLCLADRVAEILPLLERTLGNRIEIVTALDQGDWLTEIDPVQFEAALVNMCVNARDAMLDGGRLVIETYTTTFSASSNQEAGQNAVGDHITLAVSDTGIGMTKEVQARMFEPFFTTKAVGEGSGLGLAMVYGFINQSGGFAKVFSEPELGTTLTLNFPRLANMG